MVNAKYFIDELPLEWGEVSLQNLSRKIAEHKGFNLENMTEEEIDKILDNFI